jgi:Mor family transcriptional regulator
MNGSRLTKDRISKLNADLKNEHSPACHEIALEDLHPVYQVFASLIGVENALIIGRELGGTNMYLPKLAIEQMQYIRERNHNIIEGFNGQNHNELARKYKLTHITIREILKKEALKKKGDKSCK